MQARATTATASSPSTRLTRTGSLVLAGALAVGLSLTIGQAAVAQDTEANFAVSTVSDDLGTYLVDAAGATLYYFVPDPPGGSVCEGDCLDAWPPLLVEAERPTGDEGVTGTLASFPRPDGSEQVTYRGRPLYYFAGDQAPGDTNGQGVADVWWVAAEDGSLVNAVVPDSPELTLEADTSDLGTFITAADGRTTYYFSVDMTPGVSECDGDCLDAWPPVTVTDGGAVAAAEGVPGVVGLITGSDGQPQVTYDGRPLYYFAGDGASGDTNGHGVADVWWVATTDGRLPGE